HQRVVAAPDLVQRIGRGDGERETAGGGRGACEHAARIQGQAGRQGARGHRETVRRGAAAGGQGLLVRGANRSGWQRGRRQRDRRRVHDQGVVVVPRGHRGRHRDDAATVGARAGGDGGGDGEIVAAGGGRDPGHATSAVQRQARGQGAGGDREGVGRGTTAGGEGLVVGAADDAIGQGGRRQHDGRRRGCLDVDRIGLAAAEPVAVGRGDGEVE